MRRDVDCWMSVMIRKCFSYSRNIKRDRVGLVFMLAKNVMYSTSS
jgi:hypothetical protein